MLIFSFWIVSTKKKKLNDFYRVLQDSVANIKLIFDSVMLSSVSTLEIFFYFFLFFIINIKK